MLWVSRATLIVCATSTVVLGSGISAVEAGVDTDVQLQILPLDCLFSIVNDGVGTIKYLTPQQCGYFSDNDHTNAGVVSVTALNGNITKTSERLQDSALIRQLSSQQLIVQPTRRATSGQKDSTGRTSGSLSAPLIDEGIVFCLIVGLGGSVQILRRKFLIPRKHGR
jgi:hypothetical protein